MRPHSSRHAVAIWTVIVCLLIPSVALADRLAPADRRAAIDGVAQLIEDRYVDASKGHALAQTLRAEARRDLLSEHHDPRVFADALTQHLRRLSGDGHFQVSYAPNSAATPDAAAYDAASTQRWYGPGVNHGFESVERLEGGVGYLDLRVFAPVEMAGDMAQAAMTLLAQSDVLIIDLRRNGGGHAEMTHLLAAYLLDAPIAMSGVYDRPSDTHTPAMTPAWAPGRRFGGARPVYVLIGPRTFSAAEAFAYDLQAAGRVVVVGEASGGGAHPFENRRVDSRFVLALPEARSINPFTGGNWQGVGVTPDVAVPADQALETALGLARAASDR